MRVAIKKNHRTSLASNQMLISYSPRKHHLNVQHFSPFIIKRFKNAIIKTRRMGFAVLLCFIDKPVTRSNYNKHSKKSFKNAFRILRIALKQPASDWFRL